MKNILGLLVSLLVLAGLAFFLMKSNPETKNTLESTGANFKIQKDDVHRIMISRKANNNLEFVREGNQWKINGKYYANLNTMSNLLNTMQKIDLIFIPHKTHHKMIVSDMEKIGIHVEAFDKSGDKIKGYTIGSNTVKNDASYFMLDGETQPYAINIKGFSGTIRDRYNYNIESWKDKTIFNESADNISSVKVTYPKKSSYSFVMQEEEGVFQVTPGDPYRAKATNSINKAKVEAYLHSFKNVVAEGYDNRNMRKDSIKMLTSFVEFDVRTKNGRQYKYKMIPFREVVDPNVNIADMKDLEQVERYFVTNEETGDFLVMQQRIFKDLLRSYDYFY